MNSLGHLILFLEHLNCLNALASKQTSKRSLHPRHCCLCGWNLYEISPPRGEKLNAARTTLKPSGGHPFTGWGAGQMRLIPNVALPRPRSNLWSLKLDSTLCGLHFSPLQPHPHWWYWTRTKNSKFLNTSTTQPLSCLCCLCQTKNEMLCTTYGTNIIKEHDSECFVVIVVSFFFVSNLWRTSKNRKIYCQLFS